MNEDDDYYCNDKPWKCYEESGDRPRCPKFLFDTFRVRLTVVGTNSLG